MKGEDETLDTFYHGRILVLQKKKGYRFSADAPLLADFIRPGADDELLELGAGNGIISLLLSVKPFRSITCLEIQETPADLARRNVVLNHLEERITVIRADLRTFRTDRRFDIVFSNPPYIKKTAGFLSRSSEKSISKHELMCDIFGIMRKTFEFLKENGRACFIYPVKRQDDFFKAASEAGLRPAILRFVFPRRTTPANLLLAEFARRATEVRELPPLILYDERGDYTEEAEAVFRGECGV